jgi:probable rRNA maturation factor
MDEDVGDPDRDGPAALVDLIIEDPHWEETGLAQLAERGAREALAACGLAPEDYEISLLACDDARIATLNAEFRGKDAPTNVLSWPAFELGPKAPGAAPQQPVAPADDEPVFLGDLALAHGTCLREAVEQGIPLDAHLTHLVVHGCLHLLGYDHVDARDAARMEALETKILARLGVPDPYTGGGRD